MNYAPRDGVLTYWRNNQLTAIVWCGFGLVVHFLEYHTFTQLQSARKPVQEERWMRSTFFLSLCGGVSKDNAPMHQCTDQKETQCNGILTRIPEAQNRILKIDIFHPFRRWYRKPSLCFMRARKMHELCSSCARVSDIEKSYNIKIPLTTSPHVYYSIVYILQTHANNAAIHTHTQIA